MYVFVAELASLSVAYSCGTLQPNIVGDIHTSIPIDSPVVALVFLNIDGRTVTLLRLFIGICSCKVVPAPDTMNVTCDLVLGDDGIQSSQQER